MTVLHQALFGFLQALAPVPAEELAKLALIFRPAQLRAGQFFLRAGERPHHIGFLVTGLCRLFYSDEAGAEWTKAFCTEHSLVAAYSALLSNAPSRLFIQALEESTLLVADYGAYQTLATGHACWETINRKIAEALFIKKEQRESELLLDAAPIRYRKFLAEYPGLEARVKQYHIASYLGITPVSLSRIRSLS